MKKTILTFAILTFTFVFLTGCKTQEEKVDDAQEKVYEAEEDLFNAERDSITDYQAFKIEIAEKIADNEAKISNFKLKASDKRQEIKDRYNERVINLEKKNVALKEKMKNYSQSNAAAWDNFKREIKENTTQLEKEFNELNTK